MKKSDILNKAAEIMMESGHGKGRYEAADGRLCLVGACVVAVTEKRPSIVSVDEIAVIEMSLSDIFESVTGTWQFTTWNDRPETTEEMAIGVLHEAAILAKEQGD